MRVLVLRSRSRITSSICTSARRAPRGGYHARLAVGLGARGGATIPLSVLVGPNHLSSQYIADTNDGLIPHAITSGFDVSASYLVNASCWFRRNACLATPSPWEFAAFYARQWSTYDPEVGQF